MDRCEAHRSLGLLPPLFDKMDIVTFVEINLKLLKKFKEAIALCGGPYPGVSRLCTPHMYSAELLRSPCVAIGVACLMDSRGERPQWDSTTLDVQFR